jgi:hypothetical protein
MQSDHGLSLLLVPFSINPAAIIPIGSVRLLCYGFNNRHA